jgi:hypothetical protein
MKVDDCWIHVSQRNKITVKETEPNNSFLNWNWRRESPPEIVLVIFILVLFFTIPKEGCGVDKTQGDGVQVDPTADAVQVTNSDE